MKEFDNTLKTPARETLQPLVGARLLLWGQPFPQDERASRHRAFEHVRLETSRGTFMMSLTETGEFPDTCSMVILGEPAWLKMIEANDSVVHPDEWHDVRIDRTIQSVRVFSDSGTDVRGADPDVTVVRDTCGIAFILDDGTALLFEKTYSGSEIWDVSISDKGAVLLSGRNPDYIVSKTL